MPWFATIDDDRFILKYTPVHATVLAAGSLLPGPERIALALVAAAMVVSVLALGRELGLGRTSSLIAATLFALSPLTLQLEITYLPYGTSLTFGLVAMTLALRSVRLGSRAAGVAAGFVWGIAFFARPYDGILWLVIITLGVILTDRSRSWPSTAMAGAIGAVMPIAVFLAFNEAVTGDAFQLPFNLLEEADRLGFGPRRALPGDAFIDYGIDEAVSALGRNLLLVIVWTGGSLAAVLLAAWALVRRRILRAPVIATLVVWPLGYALFWGSYLTAFVWDGALFLGPYYYLPMVSMVSIAAAAGLHDLFRMARGIGLLAVAGMVVIGLVVVVPSLHGQSGRSSSRVEVAAALESEITEPALVFLPPVYGPYLQNPFSFLRNDPDLDGAVVYAIQRGDEADLRVRAMFPDRAAYQLTLPRGWSDQVGFDPRPQIAPLGDPD